MKQKVMAIAFTFLMIVSVMPAASATHTDGITPDLPTLPRAQPSDRCIGTSVDPTILARVNQLASGDPAWYQTDAGVPALCIGNEPITPYQNLIRDLDALLGNLRNASQSAQRQVDARLEATLPDSEYPDDLVSPRTVLLDEAFDGRRRTGFGDWKVVSESGEAPLFRIEPYTDTNGTRNVYRFGDDAGYARGAHQWLVSPEIDLTVLKGDHLVVQDLVNARDYARGRAYFLCAEAAPRPLDDTPLLDQVCGNNAQDLGDLPLSFRNLGYIVSAYEQAFDDTVYQLPVMRQAAFLEFSYRVNMAPNEDGVRMWVYTGDAQPDRRTLFTQALGVNATGEDCVHHNTALVADLNSTLASDQTLPLFECTHRLEGGEIVTPAMSEDLRNMSRTRTFQGADVALRSESVAFTGDTQGFHKARINLTDYFGKRVWILFEAKTQRNDRGGDIFQDTGRFQTLKDYGFSLGSVYAEGDGYHRNVRLKAIGATYDRVQPGNDFDDPLTTRTALPDGNQPVVVWVHNAGDYLENATLTVNARNGTASPVTYRTNVSIRPDEVLAVKVPWGNLTRDRAPPADGALYRLEATLAVFERDTSGANLNNNLREAGNTTNMSALDPNTTVVRPANAASLTALDAGTLTLTQDIRVAKLRNLTAVRADGSVGQPVQVCSLVENRRCTEHYAGAKGEPRTVLVGIRNDGNAPQDARVRLSVRLDDLNKDDIVGQGNERTLVDLLPGETRAVEFPVTATEPGVYRLILTMLRQNATTAVEENVERLMFVQRSTGLICLDALDTRECGPSFAGGFVAALAREDVTAATFGADGTLYVATQVAEANATGVESGRLAARSPAGEWRVLANLSGSRLLTLFGGSPVAESTIGWGTIRDIALAPNGDLYLVGSNSTILRLGPEGLDRFPVVVETEPLHLRAALWHNGTLVAAGVNGTFVQILGNATAERFLVDATTTLSNGTVVTAPYTGTVRDLALDAQGRFIAVGDGGFLARREANVTNMSAGWRSHELGVTNALFAIDVARDTTWIAGDGILLYNVSGKAVEYTRATLPPRAARSDTFRAVIAADDGGLLLLDTDSRVIVCELCKSSQPRWEYPLVFQPTVVDERSAGHLARLTHGLSHAGQTVILGEDGAVIDLAYRGQYDNMRDWTVVPPLAPRDNGVIVTSRASAANVFAGADDAYVGAPNGTQGIAARAESYRVTLRHHVGETADSASSTLPAGMVNLLYRNLPTAPTVGSRRVCAAPSAPSPTVNPDTVCHHDELVRHRVASFWERTPSSDWETLVVSNLPTAGPIENAGGNATGPLYLAGLEVLARGGAISWTIDDIRLEGFVDGQWRTIVSWEGIPEGPANPHRNGTWSRATFSGILRDSFAPVPADASRVTNATGTALDASNVNPVVWREWYWAYNDHLLSPWHVATAHADRPVFAANNAVHPQNPDPTKPRLLNHWDARLVSPIIDLSQAYDPAISFRHAYSFRYYTSVNITHPKIAPLDIGLIEVQYLRSGKDCGSTDPTVTCGWSPFYPVVPDDGYTSREDLGLDGIPFTVAPVERPLNAKDDAQKGPVGRATENNAFWGRKATPDATGIISSPRLTETYEQVRISLSDQQCTDAELPLLENYTTASGDVIMDCLPVNVTGRQVRVAFRLVTAGDLTVQTERTLDRPYAVDTHAPKLSIPGEGWYITDFKVLGARKLGIDLAATNLTYRVGYDVKTIGLGPDTRVPVNVTVENRGTFDALGYTGRLEVRQVLDKTTRASVLLETITLPQQPVLPPAGPTGTQHQRNHTLFWTVPAVEGAEYALSFVVVPIGIDRDEDEGDNVAKLGTLAAPIPAKTVRRFNTEVLVSPANATIDITRYMPLYLNNTGNVPLKDFSVERRIATLGRTVSGEATSCAQWRTFLNESRPTAIVDCRAWTTVREAPAGTLTPLTSVSDDLNPTTDLFWKAPARASFKVSVVAKTGTGATALSSVAEKDMNAFATYLFDEVETPLRGESWRGEWVFGPGWNATKPGFRSTDAYGFGDALLGRYEPNLNASLVSPTIDIGAARTALLGIYHRYDFEAGYDGGMVEASADGGRTWTPLVPVDEELSVAYDPKVPITATSLLHTTGDPADTTRAFTGSSSAHKTAVDGWVYSQFDFTGFDAIAEESAYESYTSASLSGYLAAPGKKADTARLWGHGDWCPIGTGVGCWEFEDLTADRRSPVPPAAGETVNTFWWSGSANYEDDGKRVIQNQLLEFEVDIASWQSDQVVMAEWWEYGSRWAGGSLLRQAGGATGANATQVLTYHTFHTGKAPAHSYRFNLSEPTIVGKNGSWLQMRSEITPLVQKAREQGATSMKIGFTYAPIKVYTGTLDTYIQAGTATEAQLLAIERDASSRARYDAWADDPGFAIDDFRITATRQSNGAAIGAPVVLIDENGAWDPTAAQPNARVYDCGRGANHSTSTPTGEWWGGPNTDYPACFDEHKSVIIRKPMLYKQGTVGRAWSIVDKLPEIPSRWLVTNVSDQSGFSPTKKTPYGDEPYAFYSGDPLWNKDDVPTANGCLPGKPCLEPGAESRLLTPVFDLARVAGNNAEFQFWHRYAFHPYNYGAGGLPFSSGGVIEISEYVPQTGEWTPWTQIYSKPNALAIGPSPFVQSVGDYRGGYPAVTGNESIGSDGVRRFDPPFHSVVPPDRPNTAVQYLYSGASATRAGAQNGWVQESFDLKPYLGKQVRFAFHYAISPVAAWYQTGTTVRDPAGLGSTADVGGWWIKDIEVVGNVLTGAPVQVRFRAATDGTVNDGFWQIDDAGLFGSRYGRNVGLFVDGTQRAFGSYADSNTTVPVTLRNLGSTVRRDLGFEVSVHPADFAMNFTARNATVEYLEGNKLRVRGVDLPPGESRTIDLAVRTPKDIGSTPNVTLVLEMVERDGAGNVNTIPDNEVAGLLSRLVEFHLQPKPAITLAGFAIHDPRPQLGTPVELTVSAENDGFGAATLDVTCVARTIVGWDAHDPGASERPVIAGEYPCTLVEGATTLGKKSATTLVYSATPTAPGFLQFHLKGTVVDGAAFEKRVGTMVSTPLLAYGEDFGAPSDVLNYTREPSQGALWSFLRGREAPGSLLLGVNESQMTPQGYANLCGGAACRASTTPIDLHNYSRDSPAFLSFWHLDRLAKFDGAQVRARVLLNELRPSAGWSPPCILQPLPQTPYDGPMRQYYLDLGVGPAGPVPPLKDGNAGFADGTKYSSTWDGATENEYFISPNGVWEETWQYAVFDLSQPCVRVDKAGTIQLTGNITRIDFELYPSETPSGPLRRGVGQGIYFDDIAIGPHALSVRPATSPRAMMLDNSTKAFHVVVENLGAVADVVRLEFDARNSSAPAGSVRVPADEIVLAPGESRQVRVEVTLPRDPSLLPADFRARVIARSALEPNAFGASMLELLFAPRQWAELSLAVQPPVGIVQEGTESFIAITVENNGLVDSVPAPIRIVDQWEGGPTPFGSCREGEARSPNVYCLEVQPIPSLADSPEDAMRVFEFLWRPPTGSVGNHTLTFEIDPEAIGEEYTRTNNVAQIVVPVSDLLIPDLFVANFSALQIRNAVGGQVSPAFDADVARYEVPAGEIVTFEVKVANRGRAGATNVDVRALIGDLSLPPKTIPFIAAGAEGIVTFNWLAQKGEHEVEFIVRSEQVELSTANNRYPGTGVTILTVKGYEIAIELLPARDLLEPSSETTVPFRITNEGNAGEDLLLRASAASGMRLMLPREGFFLRAGETYADEARLILDAEAVAGEQFITIEAIARENPMKVALGRAAVPVNATYAGSALGGIAVGAPPTLTLPVELVNEGNSLEPWRLDLQLPAGWKTKQPLPLSVVVPPHARKVVDVEVTLPVATAPGDRVVGVQATMPNGDQRAGAVRVSVLPLRSADVTVSTAAPAPERGSLSIPITVVNSGNVKQPFSLLLLDAPQGIEMKVQPASFDLAPGATATATLLVKPDASVEAGTYAITGYTRFDGVVPETIEGRLNVQTLEVPVIRQDLVVAPLEYTPRAGASPGDRVTIKVSVQNRGEAPLANVPVHLFVDDVFIAESVLATLPAGGRAEATFNWTAIVGVHTLTAVVDPYEDTVDADRADNAVSALATIGVDAPAGGIAAGRADTPGLGMFGLLAALGAALLVTRGFGSRRQRR